MRVRAILLVCALAAGSGCGDVAPGEVSVEALRNLDTEEAAFVRLLNDYRAANGRAALVATPLLNQVAYDHSLDMGTRRYFSHNSPEGTTPFQRMSQAGYVGGRAENIAAGNADAQRTFTQWRNSAGHNRNMLDASVRAIGVGRAYVPGSSLRYYWTNVFGTAVDSSANPGPAPTPDAGPRDAGPPDAGPRDAGLRDAGAGARDAGTVTAVDAGADVPLPDPPAMDDDAGPALRETWASNASGCHIATRTSGKGFAALGVLLALGAVGVRRRRRPR